MKLFNKHSRFNHGDTEDARSVGVFIEWLFYLCPGTATMNHQL